MTTPFITFNTFIKQEFANRCDNDAVRKLYQKAGGLRNFKRQYVTYNGFADYLARIRGAHLTAIQTYHLARMFYSLGKRSPNEIPRLLAELERQYDITLPAVYGILTNAYWSARFDGPIYR